MTKWIEIKPRSTGGRGYPQPPSARIDQEGNLVLSAAAVELLGDPVRARLQVETNLQLIRLLPTSPDNREGWRLSGGGNAPHRIKLRKLVRSCPQMVGNYTVNKIEDGIELEKKT